MGQELLLSGALISFLPALTQKTMLLRYWLTLQSTVKMNTELPNTLVSALLVRSCTECLAVASQSSLAWNQKLTVQNLTYKKLTFTSRAAKSLAGVDDNGEL